MCQLDEAPSASALSEGDVEQNVLLAKDRHDTNEYNVFFFNYLLIWLSWVLVAACEISLPD